MMKVLIIGGTGIISTSVVNRCVDLGMDVTVLNRGNHNDDLPTEVSIIETDIQNEKEMAKKLEGLTFDSVVQFVAFKEEDVAKDVRIFEGKTDQYIFISSASAYQKPVKDFPITEQTPLDNPFWEYSQNKHRCELYLNKVSTMNVTIVRPSHTYNNKMIMAPLTRWGYEYAHLKRLKEGKPVIIPGDGTSLWTINHTLDFAKGFVDLIGNQQAYNDVFQLTSDKVYTWEELTHIQARALGVEANIIHVPTDLIVKVLPELKGPLMGDKMWSALFDNNKIKALSNHYSSSIDYEDVVDAVIKYYEENDSQQAVSESFEKLYDAIIDQWSKA